MPNLGGWEWVILAVVALILFGGTKISGFGKNAGRAIREFKEESGVLAKQAKQAEKAAGQITADPERDADA